MGSFKNYELFEKVEQIQSILADKIDKNLIVRFNQKKEGIKANGIDCGWSGERRTLYDLCCLVKDDVHQQNIFHFVMVDVEKTDLFRVTMERNIYNISNQAQILYSSYYFPPSPLIQRKFLGD